MVVPCETLRTFCSMLASLFMRSRFSGAPSRCINSRSSQASCARFAPFEEWAQFSACPWVHAFWGSSRVNGWTTRRLNCTGARIQTESKAPCTSLSSPFGCRISNLKFGHSSHCEKSITPLRSIPKAWMHFTRQQRQSGHTFCCIQLAFCRSSFSGQVSKVQPEPFAQNREDDRARQNHKPPLFHSEIQWRGCMCQHEVHISSNRFGSNPTRRSATFVCSPNRGDGRCAVSAPPVCG
mgnify:CR=1 FL=1